MKTPDWVQSVLSSFEDRTRPYLEAEVADALIAARKSQGDLVDEDWKGFVAEWSAFLFLERRDQDTVWGTYFAPMMSSKKVTAQTSSRPTLRL